MPSPLESISLVPAAPALAAVSALAGAGVAVLVLRWFRRPQPSEIADPALLGAEQQRLLRQILARTNILLWWGTVRRQGDGFTWRIDVPAELCGRPILRLAQGVENGGLWTEEHVPELKEMTKRAEDALGQDQPSYRNEFRHVDASGTRWLSEEVTIEPRGPDEWALCGVVTDVTPRHEAESARRQSEQQLQRMLDRADCLLWSATVTRQPDGQHHWQVEFARSELQLRVFGRHLPLTEENVFAGLELPEADEIHARAAQALESGAPSYAQEYRIIRDGRTFWLSEQVSIRVIEPGRWALVGAAVDVTARQEALAARRSSDAQLERLLRRADCLVWQARVTAEPDGATCWNDVYFARSGLDHRLFGDHPAPREKIWPEHNVPELPEMHRRSAQALRSGAPSYEQEFRFLRDGQTYWLHEHVAIQREDERRWLLVGVVTDITERHRLREELQRASRLESIGFLAGGIAHDFNNILTAIMGNLAVASLDADDNGPVLRHLEEAEKACIRARDLTQQLLTFAKGGAPVRTAVQLPAVIRECADFALHGTRVRCDYDLPETLWPANADKGQVGQIVQNLVINAAQAMQGGGHIRISGCNEDIGPGSGRALTPGQYVHLAVADEGPGISTTDLNRIFDPYFSTKRNGSGLGLATVYSIISRHQGAITVDSVPGRGATFHVWLPALADASTKGAELTGTGDPHRLQGRVLVMDDEAPVRILAAKLAQRLGLEADTAAHGEEAITLCREALERDEAFDVVVMDLTIPGGMGGAEALGAVRRLQPTIRAIVSSGYSSDPIMAHHSAYGFDAVVAKPYTLEEFERVLRSVLEKRPPPVAPA